MLECNDRSFHAVYCGMKTSEVSSILFKEEPRLKVDALVEENDCMLGDYLFHNMGMNVNNTRDSKNYRFTPTINFF